jgi:hypothetical protein
LQSLQPICPLQKLQTLQKSHSGNRNSTFALLQPIYVVQGLQKSNPGNKYTTFSPPQPPQPSQPIYPLRGLRGSQSGNGELVDSVYPKGPRNDLFSEKKFVIKTTPDLW